MKTSIPVCLENTPWGPAQCCDTVAEGIWFLSTASHGGYAISRQRTREMPRDLALIQSPYSPPGWYEEDCDWAIVAIGLAEHFDSQSCYNAVRTARGGGKYAPMMAVCAWLDANPDNLAEAKAREFRATLSGKWERGGCSGGSDPGWLVFLLRGDEHVEIRFADYPGQQFYTDAEVEACKLQEVTA